MDFHRTKYRFWPVNYLASRTKDARSIYSNRELKNTQQIKKPKPCITLR